MPVRALRVTFVGELGWELYCPTEYGPALWRTLWEAGASTGSSRAATARSTACASRRATALWAPTSPPTRRRTRPASASASATTRAVPRAPRLAAREAGPAQAPALPGPRRPAVRGAGQRAGAGRRRGRGPGDDGRLRLHGRALHRLRYLPPEHAAPGTEVEVDVFGARVAGEVVREPLYDPGGERLRGDPARVAGGGAGVREQPHRGRVRTSRSCRRPACRATPRHAEPPPPAPAPIVLSNGPEEHVGASTCTPAAPRVVPDATRSTLSRLRRAAHPRCDPPTPRPTAGAPSGAPPPHTP